MREENNEIADSKITVHDKHRFEIKLDIELGTRKVTSYRVETYFFIPRSLNVSPNTYSKSRFYNSLQKYIRFKTPQISLAKIIDDSVALSPFNRIRGLLPELLAGNRDRRTVDRAYSEIKLLGAISRGAIRDQVRFLLNELVEVRKSGLANPRINKAREAGLVFASDVKKYISAIAGLKEEFSVPIVPVKIREAFAFFDEFISLSIEDLLNNLLFGIRENPQVNQAFKELDQALSEIIISQQRYRKAMSYPSVIAADPKNSVILYRRGILKKFISSILFLNLEVSEWEGWAQVPFAIAAGLAMLFAAVVTVFAQNRYTTNSMTFVVVVVISYMFKDRLKDWLKLFFSRSMLRWIADRKVRIRDPFSGRIIGYFKEAFSFAEQTKIPEEIIYRRNMDNITSIDGEGKPERVMKYEKEVVLYPGLISKFHERRKNINDIIRLNIDGFLKQADDPTVEYLHLDSETGKLQQLQCGRVYHVNMVVKYRSLDLDNHKKDRYERVRLIINRDGIISLEEVAIY